MEQTFMYICMYVCIYVRIYVYMYAYIHVCMHVCMYVCPEGGIKTKCEAADVEATPATLETKLLTRFGEIIECWKCGSCKFES